MAVNKGHHNSTPKTFLMSGEGFLAWGFLIHHTLWVEHIVDKRQTSCIAHAFMSLNRHCAASKSSHTNPCQIRGSDRSRQITTRHWFTLPLPPHPLRSHPSLALGKYSPFINSLRIQQVVVREPYINITALPNLCTGNYHFHKCECKPNTLLSCMRVGRDSSDHNHDWQAIVDAIMHCAQNLT